MTQTIVFPSMDAAETFMRKINNDFCLDFYRLGRPVETVHILGWGSPSNPSSANSKRVYLDMSKVSDPNAVGNIMRFLGGRMEL